MDEALNDSLPVVDSTADSVTRESLYLQAWSMPVTKIATRYGVSTSYLTTVFNALDIPRPPAGHWAQIAVGKGKSHPGLPEASDDVPLIWQRSDEIARLSRLLPKAPVTTKKNVSVDAVVLPKRHSLLAGIEEHFKKANESENGYLRPSKRSMADVLSSRSGLAHTIASANQLYLELMKKGWSVAFADAEDHLSREVVDHREIASTRYIHPALWRP